MKIRSIIVGLALTAVITAFTIIVLALLMYFTDMSDSAGNVCMYIGTASAVTAGSYFAARTADGKILFHSLSVGAAFVAVLMLMSLAINGGLKFNAHFIAVVSGCVSASFIGAVLGSR